ncbi:hypothetical protein MMC07_001942 [Pseudocyphellaria aurata]|nr:hypothetical protein [Pseudocyphellaria aurata]
MDQLKSANGCHRCAILEAVRLCSRLIDEIHKPVTCPLYEEFRVDLEELNATLSSLNFLPAEGPDGRWGPSGRWGRWGPHCQWVVHDYGLEELSTPYNTGGICAQMVWSIRSMRDTFGLSPQVFLLNNGFGLQAAVVNEYFDLNPLEWIWVTATIVWNPRNLLQPIEECDSEDDDDRIYDSVGSLTSADTASTPDASSNESINANINGSNQLHKDHIEEAISRLKAEREDCLQNIELWKKALQIIG